MASDMVCRDGMALLPRWWENQEINKRDPRGWRAIVIARNASKNKIPNGSKGSIIP
jgi:hypothetical protein